MTRALGIICAFGLGLSTHALHAETQAIGWEDLIDQSVQSFEDPYRNLTYDQLDALRTIVRTRARLDDPALSDLQKADRQAQVDGAVAALADDGIDADWLIDQRWVVADRREQAAVAVNPEVDGAEVALVGFAISAPSDTDGTAIVYLVPERGMCSHMPPPNPNQMIRARVKTDWRPQFMHEPVRLTGKVVTEETSHSFHIVDGLVPMRASLVMEVAQVETVQDMRASMGLQKDDALLRAEASKRGGVHSPPPPAGN
ncbi:MAG: DUF3299 domain-containing protein [Dinoroseobacter sp.]|nr:DUF3299 domain-containing protein [Dinoroseobacter sp.]MDJ0992930.1 DUF3299 domain-containing protein [Dinoroseobacter sp.]